MKLENYFKGGKIIISKKKFAILKAREPYVKAFANIINKNEVTVVVEQNKANFIEYVNAETDFRLITFDMKLPFELVGFLAKIASALAEEKISIFVISSYSTDHILVKQSKLEKAKKKLKALGFIIEDEA